MDKPTGRIRRVVIDHVKPEINGGLFPIKRTAGEKVEVTANLFADGHDQLRAEVLYRSESQHDWQRVEMRPLGNDRWAGTFSIKATEDYLYTVRAWPDPFQTWVHDLRKRREAEQDLSLQFLIGSEMVARAAARANGRDAERLRQEADKLRGLGQSDPEQALEEADGLLAIRRRPGGTGFGLITPWSPGSTMMRSWTASEPTTPCGSKMKSSGCRPRSASMS